MIMKYISIKRSKSYNTNMLHNKNNASFYISSIPLVKLDLERCADLSAIIEFNKLS